MKKKPFFANFLENQIETSDVKGGGIVVTMKHPSDNDEGGVTPTPNFPPDLPVTLKYPSDNDEFEVADR
ncbi:MAG: microviridin/marinostatin family tricyclic proteinase inhibitor [Bacteroidales bacterium]|nr:microviridin/marinostatin family tricyclic proteinase inhibitor [Bacteroidales bacterium]